MLRVPMGGLTPLLHGRHSTFNPQKVNVLFIRPAEGKGLDLVTAIAGSCRLLLNEVTH